MSAFHQDPPRLGNTFTHDSALCSQLRRLLPPNVRADVERDLVRFGERCAGELMLLASEAEAQPPRHVPFDAWGKRIDDIVVSDAWVQLERASAEEGIVALAYERRHGAWSRVHALAKLYLFHPSSATYSCPLAMTDGAARVLAHHAGDDEVLMDAYRHLTSRDPAVFWTSGQWMTERAGGSDVSRTSTIAVPNDSSIGEGWRLSGVKWFTSATTSQIALALGRSRDGLGLFLVHRAGGGIRVERLKEKLGTRALPTAELTLDDTPARLVGGVGRGVRTVAEMLNITRVYNATCAAAGMRRAIMLARDYARRREAFGAPLIEQPLHAETLGALEVEARGALALVLHVACLLGRDEANEATDAERAMLRVLTPVAKLFTGKQAVAVASEAIEAFGGAGYIEDTGLPRLLRDAQVLAIWEGTTNVLSLDVLRAIAREGALAPLLADVVHRAGAITVHALAPSAMRVREAAAALAASVPSDRHDAEAGARDFAMSVGRTVIGALLLEHAAWASRTHDDDADAASIAARRWCARELMPSRHLDAEHRHETDSLLRDAPRM